MKDGERRADATLITMPAFEAKEDHIVAVLPVPGFGSLGLRFESPEHLMEFTTRLMNCAADIWPDHPIIKMYLED